MEPSPPRCAHWGTSPKERGKKRWSFVFLAPPLGELARPISREAVTERASPRSLPLLDYVVDHIANSRKLAINLMIVKSQNHQSQAI